MANPWIDIAKCKNHLADVFQDKRQDLSLFGSTINQIHEAFVFGELIRYYRSKGWKVEIVNPSASKSATSPPAQAKLRLKFSTRGKPSAYSYARCTKGKKVAQIHHQLRVATATAKKFRADKANVCLDVAVIKEFDVSALSSDDPVANKQLITFGEAKHMVAFAELLAGFVGMVHELQPKRLRISKSTETGRSRLSSPLPFLYVSGWLNPTAQGILSTIKKRGFEIDLYSQDDHLVSGKPNAVDRSMFTGRKPVREKAAPGAKRGRARAGP
jgi:hypothetical protein